MCAAKDLRVCHTQHCSDFNSGTQLQVHFRQQAILLYGDRGRGQEIKFEISEKGYKQFHRIIG